MFLVPSVEQFNRAFQDPYYIQVVAPDEREFVDREGPAGGLIASFQGKMLDMVHHGQGVVVDVDAGRKKGQRIKSRL